MTTTLQTQIKQLYKVTLRLTNGNRFTSLVVAEDGKIAKEAVLMNISYGELVDTVTVKFVDEVIVASIVE